MPGARRLRFLLPILLSTLVLALVQVAPAAGATLDSAEAALRAGDLIGAMRAFRGVLAADPDSWRARDGIGRTFRAGSDLESAERELRRAVELAPPNAPPAEHLADLLLSLPNAAHRAEGLAWLGEHAADSGAIQMLVARACRREGDFVTARAALARARTLMPESEEAMGEEILLHRDALEYERAEALALEFIERYPTYHRTHVQLARIYRLQDRLDEAIVQYRLALDLSPEEPTALTRLGEIYLDRRELDQARPLLERAIMVAPKLYPAHYLLARVHLLQGDREAATREMQTFRELKDAMRAHTRLAGGAAMVDE